jgi:hypothetical protein
VVVMLLTSENCAHLMKSMLDWLSFILSVTDATRYEYSKWMHSQGLPFVRKVSRKIS